MTQQEREREQNKLKNSLNSYNPNATNSANPQENPHNSKQNLTPQNSLSVYKKLEYNALNKDEQREGFIFHILSDFVSENSRAKLDKLAKELSQIYPCEIHIHICDDKILSQFPTFRDNYLAYFRFFIPDFMPQNLKRCLYLDVDMLALHDLRGLWALNLDYKITAIIHDVLWWRTYLPISKNPQKADFDFGDFYLNSGFLLMNLDEWRKANVFSKMCDYLSNYYSSAHDQDALSAIIPKEKAVVLPLEFNCLTHLYYPSIFAEIIYRYKMPYSNDEVKSALENPIILHWAGDGKPYHSEFWRVDAKGEILGLCWWQIAFQTPFFKDELKKLFATKKENYLICKEFGFYVASLINEHSKSFAGYLKMPFAVWKAFKEFDLTKNDEYVAKTNANLDKNLAFELLFVATKAWGRKKLNSKFEQFISLPYKIYRAKCRCKKGNFRAQRGSVYHKLYIQ